MLLPRPHPPSRGLAHRRRTLTARATLHRLSPLPPLGAVSLYRVSSPSFGLRPLSFMYTFLSLGFARGFRLGCTGGSFVSFRLLRNCPHTAPHTRTHTRPLANSSPRLTTSASQARASRLVRAPNTNPGTFTRIFVGRRLTTQSDAPAAAAQQSAVWVPFIYRRMSGPRLDLATALTGLFKTS